MKPMTRKPDNQIIALPESIEGVSFFLVGIKGTGLSALAELLHSNRASVSGSDTAETFYTDSILESLGIPYVESFESKLLPEGTDFVVYSPAYDPGSNPQLLEAKRRGLTLLTYPEALGLLSRNYISVGIAGVHGKSTTTAMAGTVANRLKLPVSVVAGTAVPTFDGRSTIVNGNRYLIAETCEYRRHFLNYRPECIVITSVELDHPDYYRDEEDVRRAFEEYALNVVRDGAIIYCADDAGANAVASRTAAKRGDIRFISYGRNAEGAYRITDVKEGSGTQELRLAEIDRTFVLRIPGEHNVLNASAVVAVAEHLCMDYYSRFGTSEIDEVGEALESFRGSRRRSEIVGEAAGVLFMDDYGHHPTAIRSTLNGLRRFYRDRRIIVDFMPHTYSRTERLFHSFAASFDAADVVIINEVYASAREREHAAGAPGGEELARAISATRGDVRYFGRPDDAVPFCIEILREGDLFVTMGAGDNWLLSHELYNRLRSADR